MTKYTHIYPVYKKNNWCRQTQMDHFIKVAPDIFVTEEEHVQIPNPTASRKYKTKLPPHLRQKVKNKYITEVHIPRQAITWFRGYPYQHTRTTDPYNNAGNIVLKNNLPFIMSFGTGGMFAEMRIKQIHKWIESASLILAQCHSAAEQLKEINPNVIVLTNPVDTDTFHPSAEDKTGKLSIGVSGNFVGNNRDHVKGYNSFMGMLDSIDKRRVNTVKATGNLTFQQMPEFYRGLDILCQTSEAEGCSNAVSEAMASGCMPIIVKDVGWHGEVCTDIRESEEGNVIFADNTAEDLTNAVKWCYNNKDKVRLAQINARKTAEQWSWERLVPVYTNVFKKLMYSLNSKRSS